ncbi:MAG: PEP-CTERM sorting domain-containing protein [Janthinobacterium lividum]
MITLAADAQASQLPKQTGSYSNFTPFLISSATFAGEDYAGGLLQTITILPASSIQFHVVGLQTSFGFDLLLSGAAPGALPNGDLPLTVDPSRFTQGTFSVIGAFSPSFIGYSGAIDVAPVPEPATVMIMLGGVLAVCAARRKSAQVRDPEEL